MSRTEKGVFDAFTDPRGVTAISIGIQEELAAAPRPRPSAHQLGASGDAGASRRSVVASSAAAAAARGAVIFAYPAPGRPKTPCRTLAEALAAHAAASSSAGYMAAHELAVGALPGGRKARRGATRRRRADDARVQQLRGIFAGHDSNRDGFLSEE